MEHEPAVVQVVAPARARSAGVILVDPYGRILLQLRDKGPRGWGIPGGKVENDEDPEHGARRELYEETGLTAGALGLYDSGTAAAVKDGVAQEIDYWIFYGNTWAHDEQVQCNEGEAILFIPATQVPYLNYSWIIGSIVPRFLQSPEYMGLRTTYGKSR